METGADRKKIADLIDQSLLRPNANEEDIVTLCGEARRYGFRNVCINPYFVELAYGLLKDSAVGVCTVIGFPLGMTLTEAKVYEAERVSFLGADEIDMVINIGALKSGRWDVVRKDISDVVSATKDTVHKVIIETCYLEADEIVKAVAAVVDSGAEYVKTSTGFGPAGARIEDVRLIRETAGEGMGIKAAGGIRTLGEVLEMVDVGATRIGTSSGPAIMDEIEKGR